MNQQSIGLAVGSGAIRGFAAMAVIQKLQDEGITISAVSGSSIGSIVAAYLSLHGEIDSLLKAVRNVKKTDYLKLLDPRRPGRSLIKGEKIKGFLTEHFFRDLTFADTRIPLTVCAVDFFAKKPVYLTRGLIIDAVMASISIPGIFPPYRLAGIPYVDGGVLDPVPTRPLLDEKTKKVIGINLMGVKERHHSKDMALLPTLMTTFYMMMERLAVRENSKRLHMLNIEFKPDPVNMLSFWKYKSYYDAGVEFINSNLDTLLKWLRE